MKNDRVMINFSDFLTRNSLFFRIFAPDMFHKAKRIARTLSFRLSLMVIAALATLLMVALLIMLFFSRKAVKEEALRDAEQTLEATVLNIDNVLLSVEQATGNIYWKLFWSLSSGNGKENLYISKLVESNPYISDARIVWETEAPSSNGGQPGALWTDPMKEANAKGGAVTSFRLPIYIGQEKRGLLVVDVSLDVLSKIVLEAKPSPHSFCTLLGSDGSYIIHPNSKKLNRNVFDLAKQDRDPSVEEAAKAMVAGETGYKYVRLDGEDCYVFYKPFERADVPGRAATNLGWSAGIVYPDDDIFGDYNLLLHLVLILAVVGLVLLLGLCYVFIHRQFLTLRKLSASAQHIAEGLHLTDTGIQGDKEAGRLGDCDFKETRRQDEIGRLQNHFVEMQQSLSTRMGEMQRLSETLNERGKVLQAVYDQAQAGESMKTNFLYNMSEQMTSPVSNIKKSVDTICNQYHGLTEEDVNRLVDNIHSSGEKVTELLNQLIKDSEKYA